MKMRFSSVKYKLAGLRLAALLVLLLLGNFLGAVQAFAGSGSEYVLGIGDKLRITTFGETDLSGEFEVSSTGVVAMPLIGEVPAAGQTVGKVQESIRSTLAGGYLKDPRVSIEVLTYRPFFILGEVMKPGSYDYVNGMTVVNAVALAGGYTYRADKNDIVLKRTAEEKEEKVSETTTVMPGDVITIRERFF